ncbi:hypothetical protein Gorai_023388 [Gossypium raimondii]|uniref:Uncharacterized protein n=2 Tax=Gossypium raimondii TaxID=29730 RepID=A0A7J8NW95_GOSRA|nr:hypothetical protein [Gossypium raimondii]
MASMFSEGGTLDTVAAIKLFTNGLLGIGDAEVFFSFEVTSNSSLTQVEDTEPNVLVEGLHVAHQLLGLLDQFRYDYDGIWEIVSDIWMKMLIHVAKYCSWKEHALALRQGGELLTYVSLLLAHFGLSHYIEPS